MGKNAKKKAPLKRLKANPAATKVALGERLRQAAKKNNPARSDELAEFRPPMPVARVGVTPGSLVQAVNPETPTQQAMRACTKAIEDLPNRPRVMAAVQAMITVRRGYVVAYKELHDALDEAAQTVPIPPGTADILVMSASSAASKPFTEHDVVNGMVGTFLPWLADTVDRHTIADEKQTADDNAKREAERRDTPVPIGISHDAMATGFVGLGRDKSLVLVGWEPVVRWLLRQASRHVLEAKGEFSTLEFVTGGAKPEDQHARLLRVSESQWAGCTNTTKAFDDLVQGTLAKAIDRVDLLVVHDLAKAYTAGFHGRPDAANAGDAQRRLRKWCTASAAAMLAAVPVWEKGLPDLSPPEFNQLRTFTHLTPVTVEEEGENYKITVGAMEASVFLVPKSEIDNTTPSVILA